MIKTVVVGGEERRWNRACIQVSKPDTDERANAINASVKWERKDSQHSGKKKRAAKNRDFRVKTIRMFTQRVPNRQIRPSAHG